MKKNRGFTLVELIVVLVILAILAAVLVPALLGYIDKAKEKEDINRAKACLDAAQGGFVEAYAKDKPIDEAYNVLGLPVEKKHGSYNDIDATESDVAKLVKNCTDEDPYIFMVATGSCADRNNSKHDLYTVYYACYVREKDSRPYYYYNGAWTKENPTAGNRKDVFEQVKGKGNKLKMKNKTIITQYYLLCNKDNKTLDGTYAGNMKNLWYYLKEYLENKYK